MICMQEARLKALNSNERGTPLPSEYNQVKDAICLLFKEYTPVWSLADNRYAGTLTLLHKRLGFEKTNACFTTNSAIDLLLEHYNLHRAQVGFKEPVVIENPPPVEKYKLPDEQKKAPKQTSVMSFFAPKNKPTSGSSNNTSKRRRLLRRCPQHHPEGRLQFFSFPDMDVLQTYAPNNGTKEESFQKRKDWDKQLLQFFKDRRTILQHAQDLQRPLLWTGDLNVAKDYTDGTHWRPKEDGSVYEWWKDEKKCLNANTTTDNKLPENVGIPGFTEAERERFKEQLQEGYFVDVWRELHPKGVTDKDCYLKTWDRPNYTWRGTVAKNGGFAAKYQGKGQRIDYFLLSPTTANKPLESLVESCDILGYGEQREGLFCGSDHCAVLLKLKEP